MQRGGGLTGACSGYAADVHMLLGDLAMETELFESAQRDFSEALSLLSAHLEVPPTNLTSAMPWWPMVVPGGLRVYRIAMRALHAESACRPVAAS